MEELEVISHLNIAVGYFPFTKILSVDITHSPNSFGRCIIVGEMESAEAQKVSQRSDETIQTEVVTSATGQPRLLFSGIIEDVFAEHDTQYARVTVKLLDTCKRLDVITHQRSYQNTSYTYGKLIKNCMAGEGSAEISVTDKKTGTLVVQYDETNWDFSMRMASQLGAPVVSDLRAAEPHLYVGLPPSDRTIDLTSPSFRFGKSILSGAHAEQDNALRVSEDLSNMGLESYYYTFIGNYIQVGESFYAVKSVSAQMIDGILTMNYGLLPMGNEEPEAGSVPMVGGLTAPAVSNQNCSGKMFTGTVINVAGTKVQVQFSFDSGFSGDHWFEYSTAYSSSDQGWYCMPEVGDTVRVFFPSGSEGEAFAASSTPKFAGNDPKDKVWMAHGKFIQLTEDGITISCDGEEVEIILSCKERNAIIIKSKNNIVISAAQLLQASANNILIEANQLLQLGTDRAFINIDEGHITLLGKEVIIE